MPISVGFCVLMIATYSIMSLCGANNSGSVPEHAYGDRLKRAIVKGIGIILKNARLVYSSGNFYKFRKFGGYRKAKEDFDLLKPTNIIQYGNTKWGNVGRNTVILEKNDMGGGSLNLIKGPTIPVGPFHKSDTKIIYILE